MKRSRFCIGITAALVACSTRAFTTTSTRTVRRTSSSLHVGGFTTDENFMAVSRHSHEYPRTPSQQQQQQQQQSVSSTTIGSIGAAALLITGNTIGAGCLVLPSLAAGPGLAATTVVFGLAWLVNVVSALVLAQVAQHQYHSSSTTDTTTAVPSSFQEFARVNLGSPQAGMVVSGISLFVNACVLAFDLSRVGLLAGSSVAPWVAAATLVTLLTTCSTRALSQCASICVTVLLLSFGSLLVPGLAAVADVPQVFWAPGLAPDVGASLGHTAPIVLMSMIFQNIVPTVTKLLHYDRAHTATAIVLGSLIPLVLYVAWCFACLGGGIDSGGAGWSGVLMTIFSISTLGGSSMCSSMSLAEELCHGDKESTASPSSDTFPLPAALCAVSVPLAATVYWGSTADSAGLTDALALAGSFGSPVLYGIIPALMAWRQRQQQTTTESNLVPVAALPLLGLASSAFVGQEFVSRVTEMGVSFAM